MIVDLTITRQVGRYFSRYFGRYFSRASGSDSWLDNHLLRVSHSHSLAITIVQYLIEKYVMSRDDPWWLDTWWRLMTWHVMTPDDTVGDICYLPLFLVWFDWGSKLNVYNNNRHQISGVNWILNLPAPWWSGWTAGTPDPCMSLCSSLCFRPSNDYGGTRPRCRLSASSPWLNSPQSYDE